MNKRQIELLDKDFKIKLDDDPRILLEFEEIYRKGFDEFRELHRNGRKNIILNKILFNLTTRKIVKSRKLDGYIECSAKTGENVEEVFETLTRLMFQRFEQKLGPKQFKVLS